MRGDEDMAKQDNGSHEGWFIKAAGAVGDFCNPFYREERQRDVWNEASAVGFQLMLWLGLAAVAGMLWLGGSPSLPYAFTMLGVIGVASLVPSPMPSGWEWTSRNRSGCCGGGWCPTRC